MARWHDAPDRTSNGYRDYSAETIDRLGFIRASQAIGLTLGEIREILALRNRGETPCKHVADLIAARAADIGAKIEELEQMRSELERLSRRARQLSPSDCRPSDICSAFPAITEKDVIVHIGLRRRRRCCLARAGENEHVVADSLQQSLFFYA